MYTAKPEKNSRAQPWRSQSVNSSSMLQDSISQNGKFSEAVRLPCCDASIPRRAFDYRLVADERTPRLRKTNHTSERAFRYSISYTDVVTDSFNFVTLRRFFILYGSVMHFRIDLKKISFYDYNFKVCRKINYGYRLIYNLHG